MNWPNNLLDAKQDESMQLHLVLFVKLLSHSLIKTILFFEFFFRIFVRIFFFDRCVTDKLCLIFSLVKLFNKIAHTRKTYFFLSFFFKKPKKNAFKMKFADYFWQTKLNESIGTTFIDRMAYFHWNNLHCFIHWIRTTTNTASKSLIDL